VTVSGDGVAVKARFDGSQLAQMTAASLDYGKRLMKSVYTIQQDFGHPSCDATKEFLNKDPSRELNEPYFATESALPLTK
jgi:hypothetical protein